LSDDKPWAVATALITSKWKKLLLKMLRRLSLLF
jgi:hypothetical protein